MSRLQPSQPLPRYLELSLVALLCARRLNARATYDREQRLRHLFDNPARFRLGRFFCDRDFLLILVVVIVVRKCAGLLALAALRRRRRFLADWRRRWRLEVDERAVGRCFVRLVVAAEIAAVVVRMAALRLRLASRADWRRRRRVVVPKTSVELAQTSGALRLRFDLVVARLNALDVERVGGRRVARLSPRLLQLLYAGNLRDRLGERIFASAVVDEHVENDQLTLVERQIPQRFQRARDALGIWRAAAHLELATRVSRLLTRPSCGAYLVAALAEKRA